MRRKVKDLKQLFLDTGMLRKDGIIDLNRCEELIAMVRDDDTGSEDQLVREIDGKSPSFEYIRREG